MGIARISSGVKGLDKLTMGGYSAGSINLIAGGPGSGKTILAIQFLISGILNGENGIYITFEEKKEKVYNYVARMAMLGMEHPTGKHIPIPRFI